MAAAIQSQNPSTYQAGIIRLAVGQYMLRSKSNPSQGHVVTRDAAREWRDEWQCDCKAAQHHGKCRHISLARGYEVAVECGYDEPNCEEILYYANLEDGKYERALRGIPIAPP